MIVLLDLVLFAILLTVAVLALRTRNLLTSVALLSAFSLVIALLFVSMEALDVGFVEAALGAGLTGVLFLAALLVTTTDGRAEAGRRRRYVMLPVIGAFVGLMLYASDGLPDRGAPDAAARSGIAVRYLEGSEDDTRTPNVVTSLLADYRSFDTLGETLVILTAALGAALVLHRRPDRPELGDEEVGR